MRYVGLLLLIVIMASACAKAPTETTSEETVEWVVINNYSGSGAE